MSKRTELIFYTACALILILFCYFRLKPIYFQTVPYTYDQGRDFLKAAEIIKTKRPTFIGPTTGVEGLFHGAWWYYFLATIFLFSGGAPSGFYLAVFIAHLAAVVMFAVFLKDKFGPTISLLFLLIVTGSSYFIQLSFFPSNNTLTPAAVLLYLYSLTMILKRRKGVKFLFLLGLSLGFIFETEVSFGLLFIPVFVISCLISRQLRLLAGKINNILYFLAGLAIPFIPRFLFEIKNRFLQSKTIITFLVHPTATNPVSLKGAFFDRLSLFTNYFKQIFNSPPLAFLFVIIFIVGFLITIKSKVKDSNIFHILIAQVVLLFLISLLQMKNFFWANYFEGIQYLFLFIVLMSFKFTEKIKSFKFPKSILIIALASLLLFDFTKSISAKAAPPLIGLRANIFAVKKLYLQTGNSDFCVRIYTPPVIPYTYNYLFNYYSQSKNLKKPTQSYVKKQCWYIIEREPYEFRVKKWRAENIPKGAAILKQEIINDNIHIELWQDMD